MKGVLQGRLEVARNLVASGFSTANPSKGAFQAQIAVDILTGLCCCEISVFSISGIRREGRFMTGREELFSRSTKSAKMAARS